MGKRVISLFLITSMLLMNFGITVHAANLHKQWVPDYELIKGDWDSTNDWEIAKPVLSNEM